MPSDFSKKFLIPIILVSAILTPIVLYQAICLKNGQSLFCDRQVIMNSVGFVDTDTFRGTLYAVTGGVALGLFFLAFVFWLAMLVHAATTSSVGIEHRAIWILLMLVSHFIGALVYYFAVKQPLDRPDSSSTPKPSPSAKHPHSTPSSQSDVT